jgi:STE24 endopeptidase
MLQLAPIILVAVLLARDEGVIVGWDRLESWGWPWTIAAAALPIAIILLAAHGMVLWCDRRISTAGNAAPLRRADGLVRAARWLIIIHFAASVLVLDWLGLVRGTLGDLVLMDELVALLPALLGLAGTWWVYYPIEQRVQSALLVRRLDEGQPIYPTLSRPAYTLLQSRLHLFVMLVPLLMILGLSEAIDKLAQRLGDTAAPGSWAAFVTAVSTMLAGVLVFIVAPPVICALLDVKRLPEGSLRQSLFDLAARHNVRLRNILLWNTAGTMINAAVLGLVGWFRYVLMTDALLDVMSRRQLLAVMAHEVGHVRRHHMPWLAAALVAGLFVSTQVVGAPLYFMSNAQVDSLRSYGVLELVHVSLSMALALVMFGWVCRRFERQADTFAVQHLSAAGMGEDGLEPWAGAGEERGAERAKDEETERRRDEVGAAHGPPHQGAVPSGPGPSPSNRVTLESVVAMQSALQTIARLNAVDPHRPSWRHGSIAWRQEYLATLPGRLIDELEIDRVIVRIKGATAATLIVAAIVMVMAMVNMTERGGVRPVVDQVRLPSLD